MQAKYSRKVMLLILIILSLVMPIFSSRQPLPSCLGPKFGATSNIPILLDQVQRYSLDDLFSGFNLQFSSSNLPDFAYLRAKKTQIDASGYKIAGVQNYNIDFINEDNLATLTIISKNDDKNSVSWGIATVNTQAPTVFGTVMIDQSVDCYDAVWISDLQIVIVDCVKKEAFSEQNYYYYIDTKKIQVVGRYKNSVYSYFTGQIKRKLSLIRKDDMVFMVRTYIALQVDNKNQKNTYVELISLNDPMKPFTINVFDRSKLMQDKLSITDVKVYKNNIYILDYYSGLILLDVDDKNVFRQRGSYKIGTGFRNFGIYQNRYGSKEILAIADRNRIIQVDWTDRTRPQVINKYSLPENSEIADLWLNELNVVVHLTAKYTNQRQQTKTRESTYVFTRGSRTYTAASLVFAHLVKSYSILYPFSNKILFGDQTGLRLIEINTPSLIIMPKNPQQIGKEIKFIVVAESKNEFIPDLSLKCTNTFEFILLSEEQTLNYLSQTVQKLPEYFSVNYPGQLFITLEKYFRGSNISYDIHLGQKNAAKQSAYFLKQNSTVITWKSQPSQVAYIYLKTILTSKYNINFISLFTQDAMNLTVFSKCQLTPLTEKINCVQSIKVTEINFRISKMVVSSSKFTTNQSLNIAAIIYQDFPNEVFFYNGEDGTDLGIPPLIFPDGFEGQISSIEFMNQYLVVVLRFSKSVILYDMNECIDNLPSGCKQKYLIDSTFFNDIQSEYFAPVDVFKTDQFPSALFIQCLDRIIIMDISANGIYYLTSIRLDQFKKPWKMLILGTSLIIVYPPATILQYELSDMYITRYISFTRQYPWFNYNIPNNFSLRSSTSGTTFYITAHDTMMQKEDTLLVLVFKVGQPSVSVLYDVYGIQSSLQENIMMDVIGNPFIGDYVTFTKGSDLTIFREYQNPRLVFENMLNDFEFNIIVSNDPFNQISYLLQSSIRSTSSPQNIVISNKDIAKTGFFDIQLDVGQKINYKDFNDYNWFEGSVLNYTIEGCDGFEQKVRLKNHIQLESIQQMIRGLYDFASGEKGGYIQAYKSLIKVQNNGTIQQFSSFSAESQGEVCTSVAYNEENQYTVSACENGKHILLYVAIQTTFKPFVIGPLQTSARHATKIESLGDIIILVDTDSSISQFTDEGRIFIYSLSDNPSEAEALNELEIIDSDDLNSALQWEGGPCFIGNANLTYSTVTETYRMFISQLREGLFVVEFRVTEGVKSVEILKISFISLKQQLTKTGFILPNDAYFTALATIKQTYDETMRIQSVNIIVVTSKYHSFLLNLNFDRAGTLMSSIITRVFYRYGTYETQNHIKTFDRYFAVVQKVPSYIESDQYSKTVLTVYDTLLTDDASEPQFNNVKDDYYGTGKVPISYLKGSYVMGQGDIYFDWERTVKQQNSGSNKLFVINEIDFSIYELSVNNGIQLSVEDSIPNNQKAYLVAQNDFDSQKFLFTITKNYGKPENVPFEYDHQRVAFSPDYSLVYTYGPSTKTVSYHSYEQWNKRASFQLEDAPAFIDFYSIESKLGFVMITAEGIVKNYKNLNQKQGIPLTNEPLPGMIKRLTVSYDGSYYAAVFKNSGFVYCGTITDQSNPKQYDFSQYGKINNIRWNPKSLKLMISAGKTLVNRKQSDKSVYIGQLDVQTGAFVDYSEIVQSRVVDLDYSKDASTLYYLQEIPQPEGNSFVVFTLSFDTKEKKQYISSSFFSEWSQVVMIELKETLLLVKSSQRAKVCKSYSSGINCFEATDMFLGGTLSPSGLQWINYGFIGGYFAGLENIEITRYCGALKYYSQADNSCQTCHSSCLTCISSPTFCSSCSDGLYLSPDNTCNPCSQGCEFCRDGDLCSCKDSYYQSPDSCLLCSDAMPGCYTCDLQNQCKVCYISQHWELANGQCRCMERYFQDNNQCLNCPNFCLNCQSADLCVKCDPESHTIVDEKGVCQCQQGYTFNGGVCQLCSSLVLGCQTCNTPDKCSTCDTVHHFKIFNEICVCQNEFTLDSKSCQLCQTFILGCQTCTDKTQCVTCKQVNHFELKNNKCICQDSFGLKDKTCEKCSSLITGCSKCNDNNTCTSCNEIDHFSLNNSKCICSEGYGMDGNKCQLCSSLMLGCLTCKDMKTCLSCDRASNFDLKGSKCSCVQRYTLLSDKTCHLCSSVLDHCILCSSSSVCIACEQPFVLDSHSCIQKNQTNTLLIVIGVGAVGVIIGFIIACIVFRRKRGHKQSLMTDTPAQSITIKDSLKIEETQQSS